MATSNRGKEFKISDLEKDVKVNDFEKEVKENDIIKVTVSNFSKYGVFIEKYNGFSGLIHIGSITDAYVKNPSDYFSIGEEIEVRVLQVKKELNQLSLSTKEFNLKPKNNSFNDSYSNNRKYKKF